MHSRINKVIDRNPEDWGGYTCRPSVFIKSPESPLYEANKEVVHNEIEYLKQTRNLEGVWDINWKWAGFEREFAISENWWQANLAINNILFLRAFAERG